jgi:Fe-S cluster assembly protein SufD
MSTAVDTSRDSVAQALELEHVASHLHPVPSYDVADHPEPTGMEEIWRFTPLKRLRGLLTATSSPDVISRDGSDIPDGVTVAVIGHDEARALGGVAPMDRLGALAATGFPDGAELVTIPAETELDRPVHIVMTGATVEQTILGHVVFRVGAHSRATIVVEHRGSATMNVLTQMLVGDGAQVDLVNVYDWADDAVHSEQINITVGRDATVRAFEVAIGGDLVRTSTNVDYAGPGGSFEGLGLYFADAGQHIEHRLFVDHTAPKTRSHVVYKGALQGEGAHTVWIGNVLIRKVAEGIDTYEENRNLVLTDGCQADSVPNLEIETGEIEGAGHASTIGRFDDQQLFYLQSRGIDADEARRLVVHGFFADIVRKIGVPDIEARLLSTIEAELEKNVGTPRAVEA